MIGNFNLPLAKGNAKTYIFDTPNDANTLAAGYFNYMTRWDKPKGINFIYALIIGAGTGGGGGNSFGVGGVQGGAGGGGAPGNITQFLQPAYIFPDTLYVCVARGTKGGSPGNNASVSSNTLASGLHFSAAGSATITFPRPYYAFPHGTLNVFNTGRGGSAGAAGAGGQAFTAAATTLQPGIIGFSNWRQTTPLPGFAGGFGAAGSNASFVGVPQGGAGGGGVSASIAYPGGNVLGPTTSTNSIWSRDLSGGAATGQNGENGITLFEPTFFSLPGAGGGGNASGVGGDGGKGGIGCGGGGGGAGTVGGRGGDGGDGLVILVCW
jgi:hypothetical protein